MSKFDTLFEQQVARFVKSGPIAGDYVNFKKGYESSDWYKSLDKARQDYIQEIKTLSEQGKPLMLSTIKKGIQKSYLLSLMMRIKGISKGIWVFY